MTDESPQELSQPENSTTSKGRARERQRRRLERKGMIEPDLKRGGGHLSSASSRVTLPEIHLPHGRNIFYVVVGIVLIFAVVTFLGRLAGSSSTVVYPNAVWIGTEWTHEEHERSDIEALVQRLRQNQIGTVYAWVSWVQADKTWRSAEKFGAVREFATVFNELYPEALLLGWVSFPVEDATIEYRLDDTELQQNIADFSSRVVTDLGYEGVFLNIEPVWNGDENFLALLRKVRATVGGNIPISVAIPPDWSPLDADIPVPPLIVPGTVWDKDYKQKVALLTDQMAVMAYNSGLSNPDDYSVWVAYQVQVFADAVNGLGGGTQVIIGIPTYDSELPGHDTTVENVESALRGVKSGLINAGNAASLVQGVAVYADWTTDAIEWSQYISGWLN